MDPSVLLMLSNLLHLHNHLDQSSSSPANPALSSSGAPLLFFTIASILSYVSSTLAQSSPSPSPSPPPPPRPPRPSPSSFFLSLSSDRIWSMDPAARDAKWRSQYGLSYPVFATLLDHLRPHLSLSHLPLPTDHALSIALSRLSCGLSSRSLARTLSLPPSLISRSTHAVTRLLSTRLYPDYVKTPVSHRLLQTISAFRDLTSLPNCCGFIASSPVRIRVLPSSDEDFEILLSPNRSFPSILLQAVSDHRKIFWDACVRAPGSCDPASHLRESNLYDRLSSSKILRDSVVAVRNHQVRPYIVGDSSYPLLPFLLTPFSSGPTSSTAAASPSQESFDAAISKGRASSVEAAIALLKGRWKILRNMNVGLDHAAQTVVACVVLHNMCQIAGEPEDDGKYLWRDPPESLQLPKPVERERSLYNYGENLRQALADDLYERQQRLSGGGAGAR
ncbi:protein ANTAGONIST OF LIKE HETEROCHROMATIN PROTEIN 1 [Iris pallida]|uniref:Protein ANTAGONIST OF LIKE HETEROCHROMATIN PROTEIN 1 n=1 Tax=Iris pallida TaxID=29817 RepID=A0AAX6DIR5_IRIPA|nr:protein ANTAGONIST OF LIKE HETEROCHROMATIN PROTEIN 1 [Iris pallida]